MPSPPIIFQYTALRTTFGGATLANGGKQPFFPSKPDLRFIGVQLQGISDFYSGSDAQRSHHLLHSHLTAGVLFAKNAAVINFLGLPQQDRKDGSFVGTGSFGFELHRCTTTANLTGCFYHLFKSKDTAPPFPFQLGKSFEESDIGTGIIPHLEQGSRWCIARVPICLPVPFGQETLRVGTVSNEMIATLQPMGKPALLWLDAVQSFDQDQHAAIVDPANATKLGAFLPPDISKSPVTPSTSAWISLDTYMADSELDADKVPLLEQIRTRLLTLQQMAQSNHLPPPPMVAVHSPGASIASGNAQQPVPSPTPTKSQQDATRRQVKLQLVMGNISTSGEFSTGPIRDTVSEALAGNTKSMIEILSNELKSKNTELEEHMHKLLYQVDWCNHDPAILALLAQSKFLDTSAAGINSVADMAKAKHGISLNVFLPDDAAKEAQRREAKDRTANRDLEELLNETDANKSKVVKSILVMNYVDDLDSITTLGVNMICYFAVCRDYDFEQRQTGDTPTLHTLIWDILILITSPIAKKWKKRASPTDNTKLAYWLFDRLNKIAWAVWSVTENESTIGKGASGKWSDIDVNPFWRQAESLQALAMQDLRSILTDSREIPTCTLYKNSLQYRRIQQAVEKEQKDRLTALASLHLHSPGGDRPGSPTKKRKSGGEGNLDTTPSTPSGNDFGLDRSGDVKYDGNGRMPEPTYPDIDPSDPSKGTIREVCIGDIRQGILCKRPNCPNIHGGFAKMPPAQKAVWKNHVESTPKLSWTSRVTPSMLE